VPLAVWALRERASAQKQEKDAVAAKVEAEKRKQGAVTAKGNLEVKNRELETLLEEAARSDRLVAEESCRAGRMPKHWRTWPGRAATYQNPHSPRKSQYLPCSRRRLRTNRPPLSRVTPERFLARSLARTAGECSPPRMTRPRGSVRRVKIIGVLGFVPPRGTRPRGSGRLTAARSGWPPARYSGHRVGVGW
jgi:hypothetical protein